MGGWIKSTIFIAPSASGSRVLVRAAQPSAPTALRRWLLRLMLRKPGKGAHGAWILSLDNLAELAKRDAASRPMAAPASMPPAQALKLVVESRLAAT